VGDVHRRRPRSARHFEDVVAEGDKVAGRWTAEGTHEGELLGVPATGKRFRFAGLSICRLAEGKMAEQWERWDRLDLMQQQRGVVPTPWASDQREPSQTYPAARTCVPRTQDATL